MKSIANLESARKSYSNFEKSVYRQQTALANGRNLRAAALAENDSDALAISYLVTDSGDLDNVYWAINLNDKRGQLFSGDGAFTNAGTPLDPFYAKKRSSGAFRAAKKAMQRAKTDNDLQMLITFTMPTLIGFGFKRTFEVFDYAWSLMRKRKWFKDHITAAVCSEEFTLGDKKKLEAENRDWDFNLDGFHTHKHILCYAKRIDTRELRTQWTDCLKRSAKKFGFQFSFNTKDGLAVVNRKSAYGEKALREVSKYICKLEDFNRIPPSQLCEATRTFRGRRLISTFGRCNENRGSRKKDASLHLDKAETTDGKVNSVLPSRPKARLKTRALWRIGSDLIKQGRLNEYLLQVKDTSERRRKWRRQQLQAIFPFATFTTLAGEIFYGNSVNADIAFAA
jgi:hypothetical protein